MLDYNPFLPEVRENPYPYYAELRRHAPVYQAPGVGCWAISRYDDVLSIFKQPQRSTSEFARAWMNSLSTSEMRLQSAADSHARIASAT